MVSNSSNSKPAIPPSNRRRRAKAVASKATASTAAAESSSQQQPPAKQQQEQQEQSTTTEAPEQHAGAATAEAPPPKPCHSARLALLCTQNAVHMGARTQLGLCPPGRARRSLQAAMRAKHMAGGVVTKQRSESFEVISTHDLEQMIGSDALADYDDQEEDYLLTTDTFDVDSDEEESSGDEDEVISPDELLTGLPAATTLDEQKYDTLREPIFTPVGEEGSVISGHVVAPATGGKIPFNHRKIRYFDSVTADDRTQARTYLKEQLKNGKQRERQLLVRHLQRVQRRERRRRLREERGETKTEDESSSEDEKDSSESPVSKFDGPMTASMSAALLIESLSMNPLESVEGMSKCYDGIVAAGVALLDSTVTGAGSMAPPAEGKTRPTRAEVMAALAPVLITALEQNSGDVIVQLAKMRRMCGTPRYQRRFVQRVAPCLIRPPKSAIWCLRHQNDMEPIIAAAELIFDSASEVFSKGWYDRGQQLLADSVRKETLNAAAQQLRNLSSDPSSGPSLGGHGHGRRKLMKGATQSKEARVEPLAEWEVVAVDRQIRIALSNVVEHDWTKVNLQAKDADIIARRIRRSASFGSSASRTRKTEASPKAHISSPQSPVRAIPIKPSVSPLRPHPSHGAPPAPEMESVFGPSFASVPAAAVVTSAATPPTAKTISPPQSHGKTAVAASPTRSPPTSPPPTTKIATTTSPLPTPPQHSQARVSPRREGRSTTPPPSQQRLSDISSPQSTKSPLGPSFPLADRAPLSPSASSVSSVVSDVVPHNRLSSAVVSPAGSPATQPAHYRMLTSTAAERKRTVAACRALRSQIQRFEDAFAQLHGRPPKGASERAPLATTYAQYREWKRAIRADAACRIQALFRGASTRMRLLRSNNPRMAHVIVTRAGRASFAKKDTSGGVDQLTAQSENVLKQLSIPVEIAAEPERRQVGLAPMPSQLAPSGAPVPPGIDTSGVEGMAKPSQPSPASVATPTSQWPNTVQPRRDSGGSAEFSGPITPPSYSPSGSPQETKDISSMSLPELQTCKRELKQQLKQYDMNFARKHGRMPVKAEKEPIRHLYEQYNTLKSQIAYYEQEGQVLNIAALQQPQMPRVQQRTQSPPLVGNSSGSMSGAESSGSEAESSGGAVMTLPKRKSKSFGTEQASPSTPSGTPSQDLAVLKAEKGKLHQMLRSYEKDFFKEHKRQVSSFADIKPVASQYRRYKEIKKAIAALQGARGK